MPEDKDAPDVQAETSAGPVPMPTEVQVGAVTFRVTRDAQEWLEVEHATQTSGYYGHCKPSQGMIYLNPENPEDVTRLSLWHEVLHALTATTMGATEFRGLGKKQVEREETLIRLWEHPTLAVLRDNPALVAYLTAS